jgi:hypothetical protein
MSAKKKVKVQTNDKIPKQRNPGFRSSVTSVAQAVATKITAATTTTTTTSGTVEPTPPKATNYAVDKTFLDEDSESREEESTSGCTTTEEDAIDLSTDPYASMNQRIENMVASDRAGDRQLAGSSMARPRNVGGSQEARDREGISSEYEEFQTVELEENNDQESSWKRTYGSLGSYNVLKSCSCCGTQEGKADQPDRSWKRCFRFKVWYYLACILVCLSCGALGSAFVRGMVYLATGSFQYDIGKLTLPSTLCAGDVVMMFIVSSSGFVVCLVTKYLFKRWASNLMLMIVSAHVANEDRNKRYEEELR